MVGGFKRLQKFAMHVISSWNFDDKKGVQLAFETFLENPIAKMNIAGSDDEKKLKRFLITIFELYSRKDRDIRGGLTAKKL